jgi:hypothetical protein
MAYSSPRTWVAGAIVTAAQLNQEVRDNLNAAFPIGVDGWTAYTPTLVQSGAVTKTVTYARYQRVGRLIVAQVKLDCTGAGTANNAITIGFPVTGATVNNEVLGAGGVFDASAGIWYMGSVIATGAPATGNCVIISGSGTPSAALGQTGGVMTAALAAGDIVTVSITYEAAS